MSDELVTIRNFAYGGDPAGEAEVARIKLETHGIDCILDGCNFIQTYWLLSGAQGGIKLRVKEADVEKANEILNTDYSSDLENMAEETFADQPAKLKCEKCGSENIESFSSSRIPFYLGILLFRIPLPVFKRKYRCLDCNHIMKKSK
jgi:hypothetical protein